MDRSSLVVSTTGEATYLTADPDLTLSSQPHAPVAVGDVNTAPSSSPPPAAVTQDEEMKSSCSESDDNEHEDEDEDDDDDEDGLTMEEILRKAGVETRGTGLITTAAAAKPRSTGPKPVTPSNSLGKSTTNGMVSRDSSSSKTANTERSTGKKR